MLTVCTPCTSWLRRSFRDRQSCRAALTDSLDASGRLEVSLDPGFAVPDKPVGPLTSGDYSSEFAADQCAEGLPEKVLQHTRRCDHRPKSQEPLGLHVVR